MGQRKQRRRPLAGSCDRLNARGVAERLGDQSGIALAGRVVEVLHRRLNIRMAHPLLNSANVGLADHAGAEGVAQVVEAELAETASFERRVVAASKGAAVEVAAALAD